MVTQFQLKNGLKVILVESHKAPVVSLQAWVRTGSADETPNEAGLSHFIEHLLFKGTRKFAVGEIAQIIEGSGGELNAYTSFDQTVFYMTLSNQFLHTGLEALSDMMGFPKFDPKEIDLEREVVVEEMRRGQDSLGRSASQLLFSTAYSGHPYGRPVIGFEKIVRGVSAKSIERYFQSRYVPRNMFLLISGDFQKTEIKGQVKEFFGELPDRKLKKVKRPKAKAVSKPRLKVMTSSFEQSICYIAWPVPPITHKDIPALDLLSFVIGGSESSRLVQKLRLEEALVESIGASTFTPSDRGLFLISVGYGETPLSVITTKINEELEKVFRGEIGAEEIQRAVTLLSSEEFFSLETVDGLARKYGHLQFHFNDLRMTEKYLKQLRAVTVADLVATAKKYLDPEKISATILTKKPIPEQEKALKEFLKDYKMAYKAKPEKLKRQKVVQQKIPKLHLEKSSPETELIELPTGDRLLLRPSRETTLVSFRAATLAGTRLEPEGASGLSEMTSRVWMGGTKKRSELELATELERIAAGLNPLTGRNSLSLGLDVLSPFEKQGRDLFMEVLTEPSFSDEVFNRERSVLLRQIEMKRDNPGQIAGHIFMKALFGDHPYGRDSLGVPEDIQKLSAAQSKQWWTERYLSGRKHFVLCGAFDRQLWIDTITEFCEGQKSISNEKLKFQVQYPRSEIQVFEKAEKEQSHLIVGYPALTLTDDDRYTLQIIQSILAGQGGRLFLELRDKQSLAYSVSPLRMEGIEGGYFGAYIGCAPDKVTQANQMIRAEFAKLTNEKVSDKDLERAQRYIVGRQDIDMQKTSAIAGAILFSDLYGIDFNEPFQSDEKYWAVTKEDILRVSQKIFSQPAVAALVGPRDFENR